MIRASFRAFAEGLIDYAGIFPPAALSLDQAFRNYMDYWRTPDAWMLGRFVCPARRLSEIPEPVRVSALARGGKTPEEFAAGWHEDIIDIGRFHDRFSSHGLVMAIEARLPDGASPRRGNGYQVFLEAASPESIPDTIAKIGALMGESAATSGRAHGSLGFKLRCGGESAADFPSAEQIAAAIDACRRAGVSIKATAGLHHPVRAFRPEVGTTMHGFLNVFGAALLAHEHTLDPEAILKVVQEEDPAAFRFTDETFGWRDLKIGAERIRALRRGAVTSFGSCSFDEPREDLRALGLLNGV